MYSTTSKRRWSRLVPVIAVSTALALVGCSSSEDSSASENAALSGTASLLPDAEGTTQYPLTLTTWGGESVIEERPERVAVIGFSSGLDALQALDVTPVYALTEDVEWEWRDLDAFSEIEVVDGATRSDPVNFENIANAAPDVIISLNFYHDQADFDRLADIAPVVDMQTSPGDKADWRDGQRLVGEALDLQGAADAAIEEAEQRIADVRAAHPEYEGKTLTIATDYGANGGIEYYTVAGGTAESFALDLGFAPNPLAGQFVEDASVADEAVEQLDADALVVSYFDLDTQRTRESSGLFQRVPPVAGGRYHAVQYEEPNSGSNLTWVLRRGASAVSLPWAAETLADNWLANIDLQN